VVINGHETDSVTGGSVLLREDEEVVEFGPVEILYDQRRGEFDGGGVWA
jgi:hypothetical protein